MGPSPMAGNLTVSLTMVQEATDMTAGTMTSRIITAALTTSIPATINPLTVVLDTGMAVKATAVAMTTTATAPGELKSIQIFVN